jgi:lysophospholipase L1-like esterase
MLRLLPLLAFTCALAASAQDTTLPEPAKPDGNADCRLAEKLGANPGAVPVPRLNSDGWAARYRQKHDALAGKRVDLLFVGDSITAGWELAKKDEPLLNMQAVWNDFYGTRNAFNLGFSGDTTANLLYRIDSGELDGLTPRAIVLLIGTNNSGRCGWLNDITTPAIEAVIATLRQRMPGATILLLGILPKEANAAILAADRATNVALAVQYKDNTRIHFILLDDIFVHDGVLDKELYREPHFAPTAHAVHPTAVGMRRIAERIEPYLQPIFGKLSK